MELKYFVRDQEDLSIKFIIVRFNGIYEICVPGGKVLSWDEYDGEWDMHSSITEGKLESCIEEFEQNGYEVLAVDEPVEIEYHPKGLH